MKPRVTCIWYDIISKKVKSVLNEVSHNKILIIHKVFPILRVLMNSGSPKEMISLAQNTQILFQIDVSEFNISPGFIKGIFHLET